MEKVYKINTREGVAFQTSKGETIGQGVRTIQTGRKFDHLINTSEVSFKSTLTQGDVNTTVDLMCEIIKENHNQVRALAEHLKASTREKTLQNIWDFVFNHIQYKRDKQGVEQLTVPARIWLNRSTPNTPSDCDDHSIFIGSLLYCLNIPFSIRIAGYENNPFSHVYIVSGGICIDTVLHKFNCEADYTTKKDTKMHIETLSGYGSGGSGGSGVSGLASLDALHDSGIEFATDMDAIESGQELNGMDSTVKSGEVALRKFSKTQLETTLDEYDLEPEKFHALGYSPEYWNHMRAALISLSNNESLDGIIIRLEDGGNWEKLNMNPMHGVNSLQDETIGYMGALEGLFKKFKKWSKKRIKAVKKGVRHAGRWLKKSVLKVAKFIQKINPINIAIRAVLRSMIKKNKKHLAIKMGYGLLTWSQAQQIGVTKEAWEKSKRAYSKFAKKYKFLGGRESKLRKVLASGWKKAAAKAGMPTMNLSGALGELDGRRSRRRKRKRAAAKRKALLLRSRKNRSSRTRLPYKTYKGKRLSYRLKNRRSVPKKPIYRSSRTVSKTKTGAPKKMSAYEKEKLAFLKLVHADIAKKEGLKGLGVVATASSTVIAAKVAIILAPILKLLKSLGLGDFIKKMKKKRIDNLSKRIEAEKDPAKKVKLEEKKARAEHNLVIFNKVADKKKPAAKTPQKPNYSTPTAQQVTSSQQAEVVTPMIQTNPAISAESKTQQMGGSKIGLGVMALVAGGLVLAAIKGDNKKKNSSIKK